MGLRVDRQAVQRHGTGRGLDRRQAGRRRHSIRPFRRFFAAIRPFRRLSSPLNSILASSFHGQRMMIPTVSRKWKWDLPEFFPLINSLIRCPLLFFTTGGYCFKADLIGWE